MNLSTWNQLKQSLLQQTPSLENRAEHNVYAYKTNWLAGIAHTPFDSFRAQYRCHIAQDYCTQVGLTFSTVANQLAVTRGVRHALESLWTLCERHQWTVAVPSDVYPWYQASLSTLAPSCKIIPFRQEKLEELPCIPDVLLVCYPLKPWFQNWIALKSWLAHYSDRGAHILIDSVYATLPSTVARECFDLDWSWLHSISKITLQPNYLGLALVSTRLASWRTLLCQLQKADSLTLSQGYRSLLNHQQLTSKILAEVQPTSRLSRFLGHAFAGSSDDVRYLWPAEIAWADLLSNRILSIPESLFRPELGPQPSGRAILSSLPVMAHPRP